LKRRAEFYIPARGKAIEKDGEKGRRVDGETKGRGDGVRKGVEERTTGRRGDRAKR
jgi:hypothetical protein